MIKHSLILGTDGSKYCKLQKSEVIVKTIDNTNMCLYANLKFRRPHQKEKHNFCGKFVDIVLLDFRESTKIPKSNGPSVSIRHDSFRDDISVVIAVIFLYSSQ